MNYQTDDYTLKNVLLFGYNKKTRINPNQYTTLFFY